MKVVCGKPPRKIEVPVDMKIIMHRVRLQDKDNAYGSVKPLVDAINRAGWMVDDDTAHLHLTVEEEKCKTKDVETEVFWRRS